jgi:5'-deoxynucleotidase YfbR-like HD superfamily hydrolase
MKPSILITSGNYFDFLDLKNNKYNIYDIANALSKLCRFNGHVDRFYSVAQHSVFVSAMVPKHLALAALFHDASEAFLGDMTRPLKELFPEYKALEKQVQTHIYKKFSCRHTQDPLIHLADLKALATEKRDLQSWDDEIWPVLKDIEPHNEEIIPLAPDDACNLFLERYTYLRNA